MKNKKIIIPSVLVVVVILVASVAFAALKNGNSTGIATDSTPVSTPRPKVNLIDIKDRPYVTLQPLQERNTLQLSVQNLPKKAKNVEILLEYDRNKGILDAVLKSFVLDKIPYADKLFLGSKSAGGATTYHDDVTGGHITLTFSGGDEQYSLQVPWRYDDTQPHYTQLATSDLKFQLLLDTPFRTPKVLVMESPGLPAQIEGKVISGPFLVRGVGPLPDIQAKLSIRLDEPSESAKLYGFNGQKWQQLEATMDNRTLSASVPLVETYVVIE